MRPRTRIRDIEMISVFLSWKLCARLILNPVSENGGLPLVFAALVTRLHPVEDVIVLVGLRTVC